MRNCLAGILLACALATPVSAQGSVRAPLLAALRPALSTEPLEKQLGPLEDLPLYRLDLTLSEDLSSYTLHETLEFTNTTGAPLSDVVLRLYANSGPAQPLVTFEHGGCVERSCKVSQPQPSVLRVQPQAALAKGESLTIELQLAGRLRPIASGRTDMLSQGMESLSSLIAGEQASDYGLLSLGDGIASLAHFHAVLAQRNAKGWSTRERKAFGDLGASGVSFVLATVRVPRGVSIASSGVWLERVPADASGQRVFDVSGPLVRDFALLASRDFKVRSRELGDVTVRAHFLERDQAAGERVLETATQALAVYERRFGPYPYPDLDVVEAALIGGAGGAEFSGLVTIASMLYRPLDVDPALLGMFGVKMGSPLEFTTAHEVAHQYWYNLVGSDARESPYVDESLTQWSAVLYFEERFGAQRAAAESDAQVRMNYQMMRMMGQPDAAVDRPVDAFATPLSYAGLVYGKGAYLYPALRQECGDAAFFAGLRDYALEYRFRTAPRAALIDRLAKASARASKVRALATRWLHQTHGDTDLGGGGSLPALSSGSGMGDGAGELGGLLKGLVGGGGAGNLDPRALKKMLGALQGSDADGLTSTLQQLLGASPAPDAPAPPANGLREAPERLR